MGIMALDDCCSSRDHRRGGAALACFFILRIETGLAFDKIQCVPVLVANCFYLVVFRLYDLVHRPKGPHEGGPLLVHVDAVGLEHLQGPR
jgi:hypothetical protein